MELIDLLQLLDKYMENGTDTIGLDEVLQLSKIENHESIAMEDLVSLADHANELEIVKVFGASGTTRTLHLWDRRRLNQAMKKKLVKAFPVVCSGNHDDQTNSIENSRI